MKNVFTQLRTARLVIRPFQLTDVDAYVARRNDPEVARYQDWPVPYSLERGQKRVSELVAMDGPTNEEWWMAIVADIQTGEVLGDLALRLTWEGRTAEVGYTFASAHWGRGYALEALEALVEYLFEELRVTRVFAMLHPDNAASAMLLERSGFEFEGHTKLSFWLEDDNSDDWIYGLTRSAWEAWRSRPLTPPGDVGLIEISTENIGQVSRLATHKSQERFVAPMKDSFTDALFPEIIDGYPALPWMRAVEADKEIVGFVMLALAQEHSPEPYLWRLLIDRRHQRRGIGAKVLELIADECRRTGARTLLTSWELGKGSPEAFYLRNGFERTGNVVDGETEGRRVL